MRTQLNQDEKSRENYFFAATAWFNSLDKDIHEKLAQLFTYYSLKEMEVKCEQEQAQAIFRRREQVFQKLTKSAPSEYQIENLVGVPKARILESILLLRSYKLQDLGTWEKVVTW